MTAARLNLHHKYIYIHTRIRKHKIVIQNINHVYIMYTAARLTRKHEGNTLGIGCQLFYSMKFAQQIF